MTVFVYSLLFAIALISAAMVVFSRHAVYNALYLIVTMVSLAGIFVLINAELAAVFQVLVYAGAIIMLFLFVIMLLNQTEWRRTPMATRGVRMLAAPLFIVFLIQVGVLAFQYGAEVEFDPSRAEAVTYYDVGLVLLTRYLYAFEFTSILLLVAIVGALVLARRSQTGPAGAPQRPAGGHAALAGYAMGRGHSSPTGHHEATGESGAGGASATGESSAGPAGAGEAH